MSLKGRIARLDKRLPPAPKSGPKTVEQFLTMVRIARSLGRDSAEFAEGTEEMKEKYKAYWFWLCDMAELETSDPVRFRQFICEGIARGKLVGETPGAAP
jgi:hypothetical protein